MQIVLWSKLEIISCILVGKETIDSNIIQNVNILYGDTNLEYIIYQDSYEALTLINVKCSDL